MKSKLIAASILLAVLSLLSADNGVTFNFAVGFKGGTYESVAKSLNKLRALSYKIENTKGSSEIINKINRGESDFGIVQMDIFMNLQERDSGNTDNVKLVLPLYSEDVHILAKKDIRSIADLPGKIISIGARNSGTAETAMIILLELDMLDGKKSIKQLEYLDNKEAFNKLNRGKIDAMILVAGSPIKLISKLPKKILDKIHLVPFTGEYYSAVSKDKFFYKKTTIKAGCYPWLKNDLETMSVVSSIVAKSAMPGSAISDLINAIFLNKKELELKHPKWKELDKEIIRWYLKEYPALFHPDAEAALKAQGI